MKRLFFDERIGYLMGGPGTGAAAEVAECNRLAQEAIFSLLMDGEGSRTLKVFFDKGPRRLPSVDLPELPAAAEGEVNGNDTTEKE